MSYIGVPSKRSAPETVITGPSFLSISIPSSLTQESPSGLGLKGERVAKTPSRLFPPSLGGRTVGDQSSLTDSLNCHISHICEKSSSPRRASAVRYFSSKTILDITLSQRPLCLGIPNLSEKPFLISAIFLILKSSAMLNAPITPLKSH